MLSTFSLGSPFKKTQKNSLDNRSIWGIFSHIEIWSEARFSRSLDLGHFGSRLKTPLPSAIDSR
jgi:hypothetical protein